MKANTTALGERDAMTVEELAAIPDHVREREIRKLVKLQLRNECKQFIAKRKRDIDNARLLYVAYGGQLKRKEQQAPEPDLITLRQAIEILPRHNGKKIYRSTIERWIKSGKIETVKIGGRRYTSRSKLLMLMEARKHDPPPQPPIQTKTDGKRKAASLEAQAKAAMDRLKLLRAKG